MLDGLQRQTAIYATSLPYGSRYERWSMSEVRINLNEPVKVKLTKLGKNIFYHRFDRVNKLCGREAIKPSYPVVDEDGYTEFQLWCFMELYGEYMRMTFPNVIEPLEIVYKGEKDV